MGDSFIVRRGGGGLSYNSAIIHVITEVGSTVTFSKGGLVVKTLAANKGHANSDGESADYYFSVFPTNFGSWDVKVTKDSREKSRTIQVSEAKQYDCKMLYDLYLYKNGDKCLDVSGDYVFRYGNYGGYVGYVEWFSDRVAITSTGNGVGLFTNNAIDFEKYSSLYVDWSSTGGSPQFGACDNDTNPQVSGNSPRVMATKSATARETTQLNAADLNGSYHVGFSHYPGGTVTVYNIWLEM